ncbi:oligodendrocyte transcription factor 1 [Marmota marmota marmota]|uniref:oligodendrocyte transcription factor 1 n=1 Tax=Marmota marmota marmota TaxID=9994 RepID=UPI00076226D2|nr:oligodendrocyte transcription factor 1 [Marmota marmota marmota]
MYYAVSQARVNAAPATMLRPQRPGDLQLGASLYELVGYRQPPSSSSSSSTSSSSTTAPLLPKAAREKPFALPGGGAGGPGLCTCAVCKFQHLVPAGLGLAAVQAQFSK